MQVFPLLKAKIENIASLLSIEKLNNVTVLQKRLIENFLMQKTTSQKPIINHQINMF